MKDSRSVLYVEIEGEIHNLKGVQQAKKTCTYDSQPWRYEMTNGKVWYFSESEHSKFKAAMIKACLLED